MEKYWLLGTLITILIQGIAHDEASLDPHLYAYQDMLRPLKLTLHYTASVDVAINPEVVWSIVTTPRVKSELI